MLLLPVVWSKVLNLPVPAVHGKRPLLVPTSSLASTANSPPAPEWFPLKLFTPGESAGCFFSPSSHPKSRSRQNLFPVLILGYAGGLIRPRGSRGETDVQQTISAVVQCFPAQSLHTRAPE